MGIFTRFRDIISANINAMLDRAEDPEKLVKLMIREMEDTLVELKAACAGVMAEGKKTQRQLLEVRERAGHWENRAALAVRKGRDDLAREALVEKRRYTRREETLRQEHGELEHLIAQYHEDIRLLEEKLKSARDKQRVLIQRHVHARRKIRAQQEIRRADSTEVMVKFEELESRIDRMESEADLVNIGPQSDLEEELDKLSTDEDIEAELQALKKPAATQNVSPHV
ncbi:MAG: phage shock protein PspA [Desulfobacterales bacterium]